MGSRGRDPDTVPPAQRAAKESPEAARLQQLRSPRFYQPRIAPGVLNALVIVKPETVIRWHRAGFRLFWRWISRRPRAALGHTRRPADRFEQHVQEMADIDCDHAREILRRNGPAERVGKTRLEIVHADVEAWRAQPANIAFSEQIPEVTVVGRQPTLQAGHRPDPGRVRKPDQLLGGRRGRCKLSLAIDFLPCRDGGAAGPPHAE